MPAVAPIYVGQLSEQVVWIRVEGKGSFQNSPELKEFATCMIERNARRFVIDLENCPVMDSTFMGTMVGIVSDLEDHHEEAGTADEDLGLEVINANPRNLQLVQSLGLDHVFAIDTAGESWPEVRRAISEQVSGTTHHPLTHVDLDKRENAELLLDAHQKLSNADEANIPRFRDVIDFLKKDLRSASSSA